MGIYNVRNWIVLLQSRYTTYRIAGKNKSNHVILPFIHVHPISRFAVRVSGELYVNGTAIIGDVIEITNASIVRTADYLPLPKHLAAASEAELFESPQDGSGDGSDPNDLDTSATISSTPLLNEVGELPGPELEFPSSSSPFATDNQRLKIPSVGKDSFVEAVEDALTLLKSGVSEFQGYFYDANITTMFSKGKYVDIR